MNKNLLFIILVLSLLTSCVEVDLSAPGFPAMGEYFKVSDGLVQYTIAINFAGHCISSLFYGALSDAYGRRPVMLIGNAIMTVGAIACVYAPNIAWMLVARFIQGLGASTSAVVAFTMIADAFQGEESIKRISWLNSLLTVFLSVAPIAGSIIVSYYSWHHTYIFIAILSVATWLAMFFWLKETNTTPTAFAFKTLMKDYRHVLSSKVFNLSSFAPSALAGMWMAFVACASFLYTQTYGLSIQQYAIHQGVIIIVFSIASIFIGKILKSLGTTLSIKAGLSLVVLGTLGLLFISLAAPTSAYGTSFFMSVVAIGDAIIYPIIFSKSLEIFPNYKGVASSAIMGVRTILISLITYLTGTFYNDTLLSYVWVCLVGICFLLLSVHTLWKLKFFTNAESLPESNLAREDQAMKNA